MPWTASFRDLPTPPTFSDTWAELILDSRGFGFVHFDFNWVAEVETGHLWWRKYGTPTGYVEADEWIFDGSHRLIFDGDGFAAAVHFIEVTRDRYKVLNSRLAVLGFDVPTQKVDAVTLVDLRWLDDTEIDALLPRVKDAPGPWDKGYQSPTA